MSLGCAKAHVTFSDHLRKRPPWKIGMGNRHGMRGE